MRTLGTLLRLAIMLLVLVAAPLAAVLGKPSLRKKTVEMVDRALAGLSEGTPTHAAEPKVPTQDLDAQMLILEPPHGEQRLAAAANDLVAPKTGPAPREGGAIPKPRGVASRFTASPSDRDQRAVSTPLSNLVGPPAASAPAAAQEYGTSDVATAASEPTIEQLLMRIQRLGASYYRLEEWAGPPRVYRFVCRHGGAGGEQTVESVKPDQLSAVADVLRQLEDGDRVALAPGR